MNVKNTNRNSLCPCGSGKKYKHCCAIKDSPLAARHTADSVELAQELRMSGKKILSEQMCERLLSTNPRDGKALHLAGLLAFESGAIERAVNLLRSSANACPEDASILSDLGGLLNVRGRLVEATACFRQSLALDASDARTHYNLGCTLQGLGLLTEAQASYRQALQLAPATTELLCNLGGCLQMQGKSAAAIACLRQALTLSPRDVNVLNNLGAALQAAGNIAEAKSCFQSAIALDSRSAISHVNMGMAYQDEGQYQQAAACQRAALSIEPQLAEAHYALGVALHGLRKLEEACDCYRRAIAINPSHIRAHDNLLMTQQFIPAVSAEQLLASHKEFAAQFETPLRRSWPKHANVRSHAKRLKVGYVSGDFRTHAVAHFIKPILRHHDRNQYEVFAYGTCQKQDAVTDEIIAMVDQSQPTFGMTDQQMAGQIQADGIDILVDLSGHTAYNRLLVFAQKPAPIQIAYVGYLSTTGLGAMDYRITDKLAEPDGFDRYYTEKLLRMPDSMWCFEPPTDDLAISPLPALQNGFLTFGSFNSVDKIDIESIKLWSILLRELPSARMLFMAAPEVRPHFIEQFREHGIATSRIEYFGKLPPGEFRKMIQRVDISLDSFPVNGATTTCESLWQGVPALSLSGERFLSRNGLSILGAAGLPDFSARTQKELIDTALLLADNLPILANIRSGMREHLLAAPLLDQRQFVQNLEALYRETWITWCNNHN